MLGRVRHELIVGALAITAAACVVAATADGAAAARVRHGDRDAQITDAGPGRALLRSESSDCGSAYAAGLLCCAEKAR
jgi:hypothetical protein